MATTIMTSMNGTDAELWKKARMIVVAMWCCVSIPLVFFGAYFGYRKETISFPTVTSTISRAIPVAPPLLNPKIAMACAGMVPFAAAYVELFFIMTPLCIQLCLVQTTRSFQNAHYLHALLWLYVPYCRCCLPCHWNGWVYVLLLVY